MKERVNILLVDDQPGKLMSLEVILQELGENVIKANSADEALKVLLTRDVAVLLVDVCMPTMDGFELAELIRTHPRFGRTAIIFISAVQFSDADRLRGYSLGAVDYIPVPIIPDVLRAKVAVFAELFRKTSQLEQLNQSLEERVTERTASLNASMLQLRESEQHYRQLVHGLPAAAYTCDPQGRINLYNSAAVELWGREPRAGVEKWCGALRLFRPDGTPMAMEDCPMAIALREGRSVRDQEAVIERPDGTRRNVISYPQPMHDASGAVVGAVNMLIDITERKAAESARAHLAAIVESSSDAILSKDLSGTITSWNTAAERMFGFSAREAIGQPIAIIIPPELRDEDVHLLRRVRASERNVHIETTRLTKSGRVLQVSVTISPVRNTENVITGVSTIVHDITQAKAAAFERERLLAILEATPDLVASADRSGNLRYLNPAARRMIDPAPGARVRGEPGADLVTAEFASVVRNGSLPPGAKDGVWECESVVRTAGGAEVPVSQVIIAHAVPQGGIGLFSTIARDITERKNAETVLTRDRETLEQLVAQRTVELARSNERLRISDRMATMGTLSAGLGHDMGNLLLPVRMRLDAIESSDLSPAVREDIAAIRKASEYLQRLAGSLRLLAIDPQHETVASHGTDLAEWWGETEGMIRNGIPRGVQLRTSFDAGPLRVRAGKAALAQMIFNLVQNAGDALQGRSDAVIDIVAELDSRAGLVRLGVRDNGPGMSEDVRRRCLEPFFTTKARGLSTGLGLALVSGLVKAAHGSMRIESEVERGSAIILELPAGGAPSPAPGPGGRKGAAALTLANGRLAAHVRSILTSLDFDVRHGEPEGSTEVWVVEARGEGDLERVRRFAAENEGCCAIVLGAGVGLDAGERVVGLESGIRPSDLRARLLDALADMGRTRGGVHAR